MCPLLVNGKFPKAWDNSTKEEKEKKYKLEFAVL